MDSARCAALNSQRRAAAARRGARRDRRKRPPSLADEPSHLITPGNDARARPRRQEIQGKTWTGIEYGEPPRYQYSFLEYVNALKRGDIARFKEIEATDGDWWFARLDR